MLSSLHIKNIVLIDNLTIDFADNLSVLTGETGAGKSILLDSLGLVLGARADAGLVGSYSDKATVTATFDVPDDHSILQILKENDWELETPVIIRRTLTKDSRSKAYINDQPISVALLKQVGEKLVEIHGQFDTHDLLDASKHIDLLDDYAGHDALRDSVRKKWSDFLQKRRELQILQNQIETAKSDEEFYRQSIEDIDALDPKKDEEEILSSLRERLMKRDQIVSTIQEAERGLEALEIASGNVWRALSRLGEDGKLSIEAMERLNAEYQEVVFSLQEISYQLENNENSLTEIDDRLFALKAQARKHDCKIDDLPQKRDEIAAALNNIENQDALVVQLTKEIQKIETSYFEAAEKLSLSRQKYALQLCKEVQKELAPLKLEKARLEIKQTRIQENQKGVDQIEFFVATNLGSDLGALNKVASGGELSRLMLAIKVVMAKSTSTKTLVFDEVDSGIGGATAAAVGERLSRLAKDRQVLVVTHSPQVAAKGQHHWIVSKNKVKANMTYVEPVNDLQDRREEIARMLSGASVTEEARAAAEKLLNEKVA
jgi:DNA repair protein RecN (Recombination protein N)